MKEEEEEEEVEEGARELVRREEVGHCVQMCNVCYVRMSLPVMF